MCTDKCTGLRAHPPDAILGTSGKYTSEGGWRSPRFGDVCHEKYTAYVHGLAIRLVRRCWIKTGSQLPCTERSTMLLSRTSAISSFLERERHLLRYLLRGVDCW